MRTLIESGALVHVDVAAALAQLEESHDYVCGQMDVNGGFIPRPPIDIPLYRDRA